MARLSEPELMAGAIALTVFGLALVALLLYGISEQWLVRSRARASRAVLAHLSLAKRLLAVGGSSSATALLLALRLGRVLASAVLTAALVALLPRMELALLLSLGLLVAIGFLLPLRFSVGDPARGLVRLAPLLQVLLLPVAPLSALLLKFGYARRAAGSDEEAVGDLREAIDLAEQEGHIRALEGEMLHRVVDIRRTTVREIMQPRIDMVCASAGATVAEVRDLGFESKHSRLPLYGANLDDIRGVISVKDLLEAWQQGADDAPALPLAHPAHFVPETTVARDLLIRFQRERIPLAIVVDEYGGTAGMLTMEDILEEIVGEIQDEHDRDEVPPLELQPDGSVLALGKCDIHDVEEALGMQFSPGGFDSAGGLVFERLGRVPKSGERLESDGVEIKVLEADQRRIHRLLFRRRSIQSTDLQSGS
ncbi:MAG TPA: hemolysin family protein [Acidobacteriota bacterium]